MKELRAVVRSTLPEATAVAPAVMWTPEQGGKRKPVTGEGRTGDGEAADIQGQVSGVAVASSPLVGRGGGPKVGRRHAVSGVGQAAKRGAHGVSSGGGKRSAQGAPATGGARETRPKRRHGAAGLRG